MLERFLKQTTFSSQEDFMKNFRVEVPENFNFGYDVVDAWAEEQPDKKALLWVGKDKEKIDFTFADIKRESDRAASYFTSLGIEKGDRVMRSSSATTNSGFRSSPCTRSEPYVSRPHIC